MLYYMTDLHRVFPDHRNIPLLHIEKGHLKKQIHIKSIIHSPLHKQSRVRSLKHKVRSHSKNTSISSSRPRRAECSALFPPTLPKVPRKSTRRQGRTQCCDPRRAAMKAGQLISGALEKGHLALVIPNPTNISLKSNRATLIF